MQGKRRYTVSELREQLQHNTYAVDPVAVADALVEHLRALGRRRRARLAALLGGDALDVTRLAAPDAAPAADANPEASHQSRCSYPESGPEAPAKSTPTGPLSTRPMAVSATPAARAPAWAAASAAGGRQTHSS
jgi:hypothetical protein